MDQDCGSDNDEDNHAFACEPQNHLQRASVHVPTEATEERRDRKHDLSVTDCTFHSQNKKLHHGFTMIDHPTHPSDGGNRTDGIQRSIALDSRSLHPHPRSSDHSSRRHIDENVEELSFRENEKRRRIDETELKSTLTMSNPPRITSNTPISQDHLASRTDRNEPMKPTPEELSKMSRSERKRHREKKRRSDVNKGFDDLMALLLQIDPSIKTEAEARKKVGGVVDAENDTTALNRVDLISRSVTILERLFKENEEQKKEIAELRRMNERQLAPNDQVMMMIPMITPADPTLAAATAAHLRQQALIAYGAQVQAMAGVPAPDFANHIFPPREGFRFPGVQRFPPNVGQFNISTQISDAGHPTERNNQTATSPSETSTSEPEK